MHTMWGSSLLVLDFLPFLLIVSDTCLVPIHKIKLTLVWNLEASLSARTFLDLLFEGGVRAFSEEPSELLSLLEEMED
jgi:hypothetical protein